MTDEPTTHESSSRGDDRPPWWRDVEAHLDADASLPDPWAEADVPTAELTREQEAFLAGLEDQPAVPRLTGVTDDDPGPDPTAVTTG